MFPAYNSPDERDLLDTTRQGTIGQPMSRPEGPLKVSGTAPYAAEYRSSRGLAHGVIVTATISRGEVVTVHLDPVLEMPGVLRVFTSPELIRRSAQGLASKAPAQGVKTVDYFGQPVAVVVAETFEQATHAANALVIEYKKDDGELALDPHSPAAKIEKAPSDKSVQQGDLEQSMLDAVHTVDEIYETEGHASAAMEPHASLAEWDSSGSLTLHASLQMLGCNVQELADCLGIEPARVRIVAPYVGGGFGSKLGIAIDSVAAAVAAKDLDRPVRVVQSRRHVFRTVMRRSETVQRVRLAADTNGKLLGLGHEGVVSNLPAEKFAEPVTQATAFLYGGEHRTIGVKVARINRLTAGSVRAPGEAVGMQVLESAMDELAEKVGIDPIELRRRNIPNRHPSKDIPYSSRMLEQAMERGGEAFGWDKRSPVPRSVRDGEWWIGMGMASAARVNMLMEAEARVTLRANGSVLVETDQTDIGTGSYAILAQIAGEMLGCPGEQVEVKLGDSALPTGAGSGGSFGAISTGSAVMRACEAIRINLAEALKVDVTALELKDGIASGANRKPTAIIDLLDGKTYAASGSIAPGKTMKEFAQASYGAFFAEVAVNAFTGETRVRRMTGAFGFGRVLNAKTARSQCLGGMVWGIGSALTEELAYDVRDGHLTNDNLADYHVPVHRDVPALEVLLLDERDAAASPLQAKGVGELGICGAAGAIANAIYNACGVRIRSFPITPDKLVAKLPSPLIVET